MKEIIIFICLLMPAALWSQNSLSGRVVDEAGKPLPYATVALLRPADSTLSFFGITNEKGAFEIKTVSRGSYVVQVAFIGYQTSYNAIKMPEQAGDYGIVVLRVKPLELSSAEIKAEYIPIMVKKDTIEYNADAFKTKTGAVAEDLLKKLPGMEVDRTGNIKAMGEDVKNVLVDGKEFFSSDPKVATKNLPADAINKVQVYDKKSEASELAGIEDGSRDKTINLLLKDGKKQAWLGDASAGLGTDKHYTASAKVYRFTAKNQFAMLGMLNNINKFGFSFRDYIDFNGGLPAITGSGSMKLSITSDNEIPVNFGQSINGLVTSGASGLNYSFEPKKNNRFYASYLGNGSKRNLQQTISTQNYTSGNKFTQLENDNEDSKNLSHRLTLGWKDKSDSTHTLLFNGSFGLNNALKDAASLAKSYAMGNLVNDLKSESHSDQNSISGNGSFSFMKRGKKAIKLISVGANARFSLALNNNDRLNISHFFNDIDPTTDHQFRDNKTRNQQFGLTGSILIRIGNGLYLQPEVRVSTSKEKFQRSQGLKENKELNIGYLSPVMDRKTHSVTPGLKLRYTSKKTKTEFGLATTLTQNKNTLNDTSAIAEKYMRILPSFSWEFDYKTGYRISLDYSSSVEEPQISLLVPVVENSNPLSLFYGNRYLKPETRNDLFLNWLLFDQFSQTSVFARLGGTYTRDKVGYSRTISDSLVQSVNLLNIKDDYLANANIEFSTPLRFAGLNIHLAMEYSWNKTLTYVNDLENINTNHSPSLRLSFDNRKKDKWDLDFGGELTVTNANYSLQKSLNNQYFNLNYFADLTFNPNNTWHFGVNADVVNYNSESFSESITIPLLGAEISYNFLTNKRGMFTLEAADLLNKNTGISRISEMNYLRETRSNILGRYVLLSFKYRLNKAAKSSGGLEINVRKH